MQSTASNLEFKLNVNLRLVKPDFMQSTAVNLEFKLKVIFKLLSCNRPKEFIGLYMYVAIWHGFILVRILCLMFCFKLLIQWKVDYLCREGSCEYSDAIRLPYILGYMWRYRMSSVHVWVNSMKRLYEPRHVISNNVAPWQAQTQTSPWNRPSSLETPVGAESIA